MVLSTVVPFINISIYFIFILESIEEKESACVNDQQCELNKDFQKV